MNLLAPWGGVGVLQCAEKHLLRSYHGINIKSSTFAYV